MKDWITIGQLAKKTGFTARAIRFYETKGLLQSHFRGDNDYRFYSKKEVIHALQIKEFRDYGFTLNEIAELLAQDPTLTTKTLQMSLSKKLRALQAEQIFAQERITKLEALLASLNTTHKLSEPQRRIVMEELVTQAKEKIKARGVKISKELEDTLRSELTTAQEQQLSKMMELLDLIKSIADEMNIKIGPGRGSAAASLLLFSKGFNHNYSQQFDLIPELFFHAIKPLIWMDVEYNSAPVFLNRLLQKTTLEDLRKANIFMFQCPFLTILSQIEKEVGSIDISSIPDNDERIINVFKPGHIENIFCFDAPEKSVMHANSSLSFWQEENALKQEIWKNLETYKVSSAEDILNLCTLSFPVGKKKEMLKQYVAHNDFVPDSKNLPPEVLKILKKTKGLLIYREDFIRILRLYMNWTVAESNQFYSFKMGRLQNYEKAHEYEQMMPENVRELLDNEAKSVFLKSHMVCMWWFIKYSAILSSLYPEKYKTALKDWQDHHHSAWSDLGFIDKDFRPLALYF
ncbi:MAG: MerR family transcriptional regulator [Pseudobdellovibrionaceae bacterium]